MHYFRLLRQRGIEAWLVVNERTRGELETLLASDIDRVRFVPNTRFHQRLDRVALLFPPVIKHFLFRFIGRLVSARTARRIVREMVAAHRIDIVHQPTPVSPKEISLMYKVGAPVIIGPMNGGITYPPAFRQIQKRWVRAFVGVGRLISHAFNWLMPGKLRAQTLLVANDRTRRALPTGVRGRVEQLVENGVDLNLWNANERSRNLQIEPVRFVFSGRLEEWKGVQYLLQAFGQVVQQMPATLEIMGSGVMRQRLEAQAAAAGLSGSVTFRGWVSQPECVAILSAADVFVLPSLYECGGAVVLEAMAVGLPVIATNWGGPADYLDPSCGVLVDPKSPEAFVQQLAEAMLRLGRDASLRHSMGAAGRAKAVAQYDWQRKIDQILRIYSETKQQHKTTTRA
ncbi:MAG TPA: glycosyltransferase family 4 protein [Tepidisphaeraceae bacterium]|nr:glycosyltransferase family 4 protein [Tepidisphaeraceae bacterium]